MNELENELKNLIINTFELEEITPDDINSEGPVFIDG